MPVTQIIDQELFDLVWKGELDAVVTKIEQKEANPNAVEGQSGKRTLLIAAAINDHVGIAEKLIEKGALPNEVDSARRTPLMYIVRKSASPFQIPFINCLIKGKADVDVVDGAQETALFYAIKARNTDAARELTGHGANVNHKTKNGTTPLMCACRELGNPSLIELLIERGALVNEADNNGNTAISIAASSLNGRAVVELLLRAGANASELYKQGKTDLMYALIQNDSDRIEQCISEKETHDEQDNNGITALMIAAQKNNIAAMTRLIEMKANLEIKDEEGKTALFYPKTKEACELLAAHADTNTITYTNYTFLIFILEKGYLPLARRLLSSLKFSKEVINAIPHDGAKTALHTAFDKGNCNAEYKDIIVLLLKAGANPSTQCDGISLYNICGANARFFSAPMSSVIGSYIASVYLTARALVYYSLGKITADRISVIQTPTSIGNASFRSSSNISILDIVCATLASSAAEQLFGYSGNKSNADLSKARTLISKYFDSPETQEKILQAEATRAMQILTEMYPLMKKIVDQLFDSQELSSQDFLALINEEAAAKPASVRSFSLFKQDVDDDDDDENDVIEFDSILN
ncbi:MAG: ankyrin repeat domain-containing protein [Legionella sp.]|nr:ankyrin repeat domain-containing protein [Legionella sp.]